MGRNKEGKYPLLGHPLEETRRCRHETRKQSHWSPRILPQRSRRPSSSSPHFLRHVISRKIRLHSLPNPSHNPIGTNESLLPTLIDLIRRLHHPFLEPNAHRNELAIPRLPLLQLNPLTLHPTSQTRRVLALFPQISRGSRQGQPRHLPCPPVLKTRTIRHLP